LELLSKVMADFEKDFGKVTKPKALEAMEKKAAKEGKEPKSASPTMSPTYFG
jgi:hypothetical protein